MYDEKICFDVQTFDLLNLQEKGMKLLLPSSGVQLSRLLWRTMNCSKLVYFIRTDFWPNSCSHHRPSFVKFCLQCVTFEMIIGSTLTVDFNWQVEQQEVTAGRRLNIYQVCLCFIWKSGSLCDECNYEKIELTLRHHNFVSLKISSEVDKHRFSLSVMLSHNATIFPIMLFTMLQ